MSFDEEINKRIREIVREEIKAANGQIKRLTPEELAQRWQSDKESVLRLVRGNQLRPIRLSERKMVFAMEEILRFEDAGGISQLEIAA